MKSKAIDIHAVLAKRRQVGIVWGIGDVQEVRPGLTAKQAWEVLQQVKDKHDADWGICWRTLEIVANGLFPKHAETLDSSTPDTDAL